MRLMIALVLLILAATSQLAVAQQRQHGNVVFNIPDGWAEGAVQDDGTRALRSDLKDDACEFCTILITPGLTGTGAPTDTLRAESLRFVEEDDPAPEVMIAPEAMNMGGRPAAIMGQKVGHRLQILVAVQLFGRTELFAFIGGASDEAEATETLEVFQRDVVPMLESATYVSEGAKPLLPPPEPGPLAGLYWGFSTGWMMQLDGTMQMELDHRHLTFWPDGRFYDGTPPQGSQILDPNALLAVGNMDWGTYRVAGDKLTLAFANGAVEEVDLATDGTLQDGDRPMFAVTPLADGSRIDGSLYRFSYMGFTPGSGISGGVSSSNLISFDPDGTWSGDSSGGASGNFETAGDVTGGFVTGSENTVSGTYEVKDGLIIRSFADGSPPIRGLIYTVGDDIYIGTEALSKPE